MCGVLFCEGDWFFFARGVHSMGRMQGAGCAEIAERAAIAECVDRIRYRVGVVGEPPTVIYVCVVLNS